MIGAGPVGLAAAAHLLARGLEPLVLEKGHSAGHAMLEWAHVRVFTPWQYITDKAVVTLLENTGWQHPAAEHLPTAGEIAIEYLIPAATTTALKDTIVYDAEVMSVSKLGLSKSSSNGRDTAPYTIHYKTSAGEEVVLQASAVIDASGTWYSPNPIGTDGLPVPGEKANAAYITYGIPDVLDVERSTYEGKRTLVLGGGHSAINAALDLLTLRETSPDTKIFWGLRRNNLERLLGGGINDKLPARGALGLAAKKAIDEGALALKAPFRVAQIQKTDTGIQINGVVGESPDSFEVDRIVVAAGFRPDLHMLRELRLDIDDIVEAPSILAPMIDPNLHSCGTVPPHGVDELSHHDKNFFIVGMKAYGRAPTFLMLTGYEQVRSIADELAGNHEAAREIELVLPETGVCSTQLGNANQSAQEQVQQAGAAACCGTGTQDVIAPATITSLTAQSLSVIAETTASSDEDCCDPVSKAAAEAKHGIPCCGAGKKATEDATQEVSTGCC